MIFLELSLVLLFSFFLSVLASFFNVVIVRTAREESFSKGRSKCDHCHKTIAWYDNVPVLSFLMLGGKCRHCHKKIAPVYFFSELLAFFTGVIFYLAYVNFPFLQNLAIGQLIIYFFIAFILLFTLLADLQYMIVPDFFVVLLSILALLLQITSGRAWFYPIVAVLFSTGFFFLLSFLAKKALHKDALGLGDIKLMVPIAFLLSWPNVALNIFMAFIIGGFFAMLVLITGRKKIGQALPFAPFLILAAFLSFACGTAIWQWYLGLILR